MDGKLGILYISVRDLKSALAFYRDQLGLEESWSREASCLRPAWGGKPGIAYCRWMLYNRT